MSAPTSSVNGTAPAVTPSASPPTPVATPPTVAPVSTPPATPPVTASPPPATPPVAVPPVASPPSPVVATPPATPPVASSPPPPPVVVSPPAPSPTTATPPTSSSTPPPVAASPPPPPDQTSPPPPTVRASPPPPGAVASPPPPRSSAPPPPATASSTTSNKSSSVSQGVIIGCVVGGVVAIFLLAFVIALCNKKKKKRNSLLPYGGAGGGGGAAAFTAQKADGLDYRADAYAVPNNQPGYGGGGGGRLGALKPPPGSAGGSVPLPPEGTPSVGNSRSWFTYEELRVATDGFATANLLGEGGFGRVYKGHLPNGQEVAVKQLTVGGGQGDREFRAEVEIISRVHHRHLVSLVGYCIADKQRLLVYDFVPNGTLDVNLYGTGKPVMSWDTRLRVAVGAARGLAYLHEDCHPRIIHRDIKSSNILLDDKYEAQVADFGLAKLASDTNTHVSTRVMGTFGYLAPEYAQSGKLTEKSDVYSFGVVLLELITGRKPIDARQPVGQESLVEWARPLMTIALEDGDLEELVDPRLGDDYDPQEMFRMIEAAASCVRHSAAKRPKMGQVVRALESEESGGLDHGSKPGQSIEHNLEFGGSRFGGGSDYDTHQYNVDMLRAKKLALGSTNSYGSEYTTLSSEYGPNPVSSSEYDPSKDAGDSSSSEALIDMREPPPPPTSVRTGFKNRNTTPVGRSRMNDGYSGGPPQRVAPQRPGHLRQRSHESYGNSSVQSGSIRSDIMNRPPPPPPNLSEEYAPIDYHSTGYSKQLADQFQDGR